jgi:signal transduction histidine kinase
MASWVGRRLSRPLSAILRAIRQVGQGERRPEGLPTGREDEIGELAEGVARLADRLGQLEGERVLNERLRLIRQVSAGLAHELRNPLTAARMTLQLFMERNPDRDSEPLRVALSELNRMERQVRRFLQIARPDPPRFAAVDVGLVLDGVAQGLAAQAAHQSVSLGVEYPAGLAPAWADAEQVGQVATNLALNALDAAGPGGSVRLVAGPDGPGRLAVVVEDDGPGIPEDEASRLFQPFFTTKPEGVGLGLALCDALVREHGGSIRHERAAGRTRFLVSLPTAPVPPPVTRDGDGPLAPSPLASAAVAG